MSGNSTPYLHAIATGVPKHSYTQEFALRFLLALQGDDKKKRAFLERVYANTGIHKRHTVIGDYGKNPSEYTFYPRSADLSPEPDTAYRNDRYIQEANVLAEETARRLLDNPGGPVPGEITHLITVSCTGFSVPGFDLHLVKSLGFRKSVHRFHIGFMGCYAAFPALKLARDICLAHRDAKVLIVALELCSLHFQKRFDPEIVVANAIFADGAAAALITADPRDASGSSLRLDAFSSFLIDDSEGDMAWRIGQHGFDMRLSAYVPKLIESNIGAVMDALFPEAGCSLDDIDLFAIHPGGRAILDKLAATLHLNGERDLAHSYEVLREFGNMSSATIFFVLERLLASTGEGRTFAAAFGPGLTVESGILTKGDFS